MPTILGDTYPGTSTSVPPHMAREDYLIWSRWRPKIAEHIRHFWADVRLGAGAPVPGGTSAADREYWLAQTQKRADLLILFDDLGLALVELRNEANANAIGRLMMYDALYAQDPVAGPLAHLILVTNQADPDVALIAQQQDITYIVT